jgi:Dolichyl-phosphate-mannose-protein mannosyltransferase
VARRNARLRAAALETIPLFLFVLAALPRVWAPDLVPFGAGQAEYAKTASQQAPVTWLALYSDPTILPLAVVAPLLRDLPSPIAAWVVLRALIDAAAVALLYLAARPLVGPIGGILAALLYAASPTAWAAARDPAGPLGPVLMSASLLLAVRLAERPTLARGAVLGVSLGLLARSLPLGLLVVPLGAAALVIGRASWRIGGLAALGLVLGAGPARFPRTELLAGGSLSLTDNLWTATLPPLSLPSYEVLREIVGSSGPIVFLPVLALALTVPTIARHRVVRWCGLIGVLALLAIATYLTTSAIRLDSQAEWSRPAFAARSADPPIVDEAAPRSAGSFSSGPSLREATALTDAMRDGAGRAGAGEIVLLTRHLNHALRDFPYGVFLDGIRTRSLGSSMVLPLERETVYLVSATDVPPGMTRPALEAQRPSSTVRVVTESGADTGARILTLRPRPAADWLARVRTVADGRFVDGSALLGIGREAQPDGSLDLSLYWQLPGAVDGRPLGARVQIRLRDAPSVSPRGESFPGVEDRRGGELVVQTMRFTIGSELTGPRTLLVTVLDERGAPIRTAAGGVDLVVPLGTPPR